MMKKLLLITVLLTTSHYLHSQDFTISTTQKNTMQSQAINLVRNYETGLNNLGDSLTSVNEKEYFVTDIMDRLFASHDVIIYNDLDPDNLEPDDLTAEVYLNNIVTKYSKGVNFRFTDARVSDPFYLDLNNVFVKVSIERELTGYHLNELISNVAHIDLYISFFRNPSGNFNPPAIYSISHHIDNIDQFRPVKLRKEDEVLALKVISPGETTTYRRGKGYQIVWEGNSNGRPVKLELYRGGERLGLISGRSLGVRHDWVIPLQTDVGKDYRIKLTNLNNLSNAVFSEAFTIKRKVPLWLKIIPLAGIATAGYLVLSESGDNEPEILPGPPSPN